MAAHDAVESVPTIAWNRCPSSVECAFPIRGCPVCLREDAAAAGPKPGEGMFLRGHWLRVPRDGGHGFHGMMGAYSS